MQILILASKDLKQIIRDRKSAIFLLGMPIAFTLLFGFAFSGFGSSEPADLRLPIGWQNEDNGVVSQHLQTLLSNSTVIRMDTETAVPGDLNAMVRDGNLAAALIVPPNFSREILAGNHPKLDLVVDQGSSGGLSAQGEIEAGVTRLAAALNTAEISRQTAVDQAWIEDGPAAEAYFEAALSLAVAAWEQAPVQVVSTHTGSGAVEEDRETAAAGASAFAHTSPGMMAQFAIAGLLGAAQILVLERKSGSLRRLLTTKMSRLSILAGHYLAMLGMIFVQLFILILFGQLVLGLPYFSQPGASFLMVLATSLFAASLGLLIGALSKSEEQAIVFSLVPMFILAALGGAWTPLEFTPESFQRIAFLTPLAWTIDGFKDIIIRGQGINAIWPGTAVLLAYAVVLFLLASWRFRFE